MKPVTAPTKATMRKAADLLQASHDFIELHGFDISHYGDWTKEAAPATLPPMCYIGTLRFQAGVSPAPDSETHDAGAGDGPELILALQKLDELAQAEMDSDEIDKASRGERAIGRQAENDDFELDSNVGRFIEHLGFLISDRANKMYRMDDDDTEERHAEVYEERDKYQKEYALDLLRKALAAIHS